MNQTLQTELPKAPKARKNFYITEILMLKSIIVLLVVTFFLLNEMQAANDDIYKLNEELKKSELAFEAGY